MSCAQEYCDCNECHERWQRDRERLRLTITPLTVSPDPALIALRGLIDVIDRTGGYLSTEDQIALRSARELLR
jgi:hypothetical protein